MKKINNKEVLTIARKPFLTTVEDEKGEVVMLEGSKPKTKNAKTADLIKTLVFNLPVQNLTMKDSREAQRVLDQLELAKDGVLNIEDAEHEWLKGKVDEVGPKIFGVNAIMLLEALDDFERLHEPKEKAAEGK